MKFIGEGVTMYRGSLVFYCYLKTHRLRVKYINLNPRLALFMFVLYFYVLAASVISFKVVLCIYMISIDFDAYM